MAAVIGIDFGNENCLVALPKRGGVDIARNQSAQRLTPTMIQFSETRRYAGVFAQQKQMENVKATITNMKRLVGLRYDSPEREVVQKLVPYDIVPLENGLVGVKTMYKDEPTVFTVEQCVALLLKELFAIAKDNGAHTDQCVIVVSPWWEEVHRRMILDAAKIAGVNVMKLLNSTTAAGILYSMYQRKRLPESKEKAVPVAIIDFGDSAMNVAIVGMAQGHIEVKGFCCEAHLGGSHFTTALVDYLLEKVKAKYKIDPTTNGRAMLRFRTAAEKLKKGLSINPVMPFEIQSIMDVDIQMFIKREEFEAQIGDLVAKIRAPVEKAMELAGVKKEDLFAIEVHGGASRVPAVKAIIKETFGKEPTQSLNPDECFAMGGGFQAAILSPQYQVPLTVMDVSQHKVMIEWMCPKAGEKQTHELFKNFQVIPSTKRVPVKVCGTNELRLYGENGELGKVTITTGIEEMVTVKVQIRLSADGVLEVQNGTFVPPQPAEPEPVPEEKKEEEKKEEEPKAEEKKEEEPKAEEKKEEEPKAEEKKEGEEPKAEEKKEGEEPKAEEKKPVKKPAPKEIPAIVVFVPTYGLTDAQIADFKKKEAEMTKVDEHEEKIDFTRNDLEGYIFKMQNGMDRDFPEFFDPAKLADNRKVLDEVAMWFSEYEFDRLTLQEYETQLKKLQAFGEPVLNRRKVLQQMPSKIAELKDRVSKASTKLSSTEEKFKHITEEDRKPAADDIAAYLTWLDAEVQNMEKAPKYKTCPFKFDEAERKVSQIETKVNTTMAKPVPPPPKPKEEPKKEEEAKAEEKKEGEEPKAEEKTEEEPKAEEEKKAEVEAPSEVD